MIGVIANPSERAVVAEFFELFKTPWEWFRSDACYSVVLCTNGESLDTPRAEMVILYAGHKVTSDGANLFEIESTQGPTILVHQRDRLPIYGDLVTFPEAALFSPRDRGSGRPAMCRRISGNQTVMRIGYDLFREIEYLLTEGQPADFAHIPAIELHIALLRDVILSARLELIEVPPIPYGYQFVACLTHDVDHPSISRHKWDHTIFGFLYRAIVGSMINLLRQRIGWRALVTNWSTALRLPFVYLSIAKDFWQGFDDRYLALEQGLSSTYFFIPFKDKAGKCAKGTAPKRRAAGYGATELADTISKIVADGCEVGLHGIDAWMDPIAAREELDEIRRITGAPEVGVRMHWLYCSQDSPAVLEEAGAAYDSTVGYRETVGYRAGTIQAYKPLNVQSLLELPLHVMDTAMFYPAYMGLSSTQATSVIRRFTCDANRFGGCFTINWHDRSLAPERLWSACYRSAIDDLKGRNAWFANAGQAAAWFRKRRSVVFEEDDGGTVRVREDNHVSGTLPGLRLRVHRPCRGWCNDGGPVAEFIDLLLREGTEVCSTMST